MQQLTTIGLPTTEQQAATQDSNCIIEHKTLARRPKSTTNKKYVLWNAGFCPIASKVGHVTFATPPLGHSSFLI